MTKIYLVAGLAAVLFLGGCNFQGSVDLEEEQASDGEVAVQKTVYQYEEPEPEPEPEPENPVVVVEQPPPDMEVDAPDPPPVVVSKTYVPTCPGPGFSSAWTKNQAVHSASTPEGKADFLSCPIIPPPRPVPVVVPKVVPVPYPVTKTPPPVQPKAPEPQPKVAGNNKAKSQ